MGKTFQHILKTFSIVSFDCSFVDRSFFFLCAFLIQCLGLVDIATLGLDQTA